MRLPHIPTGSPQKLEFIHRLLFRIFIAGLPIGIGILIFGTMAVGLFDRKSLASGVPLRVSALAEVVLACACGSLAAAFLLEAYAYAKWHATSTRYAINVLLTNFFAASILGSAAVVLIVMAVREWRQ